MKTSTSGILEELVVLGMINFVVFSRCSLVAMANKRFRKKELRRKVED